MALNRSTRNLQSIGTRLLEERTRMGLSQREMAELGGVSRPSYRLYEDGKREPALGYILSLGDQGADIVYLLYGNKKRNRSSAAICLSESALATIFENTCEVIDAEYGGKLGKRDRKKLFVQMCRLASTSDSTEIDIVSIAHELKTYLS